MQCKITIDAQAIRHNYKLLQSFGTYQLCPVLKSNAYGHGLELVYRAIESLKPKMISIAYLEEARQLRQLGCTAAFLLVTPLAKEDIEEAAHLGVECFLSHMEQFYWLKSAKQTPRIHIKIDTGLTRQGLSTKELTEHWDDLKTLDLAGVCTHFANVEDVLEHEYADLQLSRFDQVRQFLRQKHLRLLEHAASSASTLILPQSRLDMCRTGISLYGYWPSHLTKLSYLQLNQKMIDLQPALRWSTSVAQVKNVSAGTYIGYGCTFKATKDMTVAVLPLGYFEGYSRSIADAKSYVLIRGQRCNLVGRISMNMMVVDISQLENVAPGEEVILLGQQDKETISAETLADWAGTIQYELLTRLHLDIPRESV